MATSQERKESLLRYPDIHDLLWKLLPEMHSSSVKHEYLSKVANVIAHQNDHPELTYFDEDNQIRYTIGWGDYFRSLPVLVVTDTSVTPEMVLHAEAPQFIRVPQENWGANPESKKREERRLVENDLIFRLNAEDHAWRIDNDHIDYPRDLVLSLQQSRRYTDRRGISPYPPDILNVEGIPPKGWYSTDPLVLERRESRNS